MKQRSVDGLSKSKDTKQAWQKTAPVPANDKASLNFEPFRQAAANETSGRICPPARRRLATPIRRGEPSPSPAFLVSPRHTSAPVENIRQLAMSVASKRSVRNPADRKTRGSFRPSCSESRMARCPPEAT
jgi:hypothetical protein